MLHVELITQKPSLEGQAIILPSESWEAAKQYWPELNQLQSQDWPELGQSRIFNKGAGCAWVLLNCDWKKTSAIKTFKAMLKQLDSDKFSKAVYFFKEKNEELHKRVYQAIDAFFLLDDFLSKKKEVNLKQLAFFVEQDQAHLAGALQLGQKLAKSLRTTKSLAEMPGNYCTPAFMGQKALEIAKQSAQISADVLGFEEIKKLKMGSFLSVSQGSAQEPKFIIMQYKPLTPSSEAPIVFVGKGITFDTGGHSLKPAQSMIGMKFDMSGGATVLGLFDFLAQNPVDVPVIGLIPCCENIPGGLANKPDDVITSMSGQTIEVLNTDAEGRLILCDALTYAERFNPRYVIDVATLTGSCMATFGGVASGLMGNSPELIERLKQSAARSGDKVWELPLWEDWHDDIKSPIADMANIGNNHSGAIIAGCFLQKFAKSFSWAHLDIAGTACSTHGPKRGATGRPLPLLIDFLLDIEKNKA